VADGREPYYLGLDNQVYATSLTAGPQAAVSAATSLFPVRLTTAVAGATWFDGIEVTSDDQRFLVNQGVETPVNAEPVTVKVNWPSDLKR